MSRAKALEAAAAAVRNVQMTCDASAEVCGCCGLKKHANWEAAQIHIQLGAAAHKLEELANRLQRMDSGQGVTITRRGRTAP